MKPKPVFPTLFVAEKNAESIIEGLILELNRRKKAHEEYLEEDFDEVWKRASATTGTSVRECFLDGELLKDLTFIADMEDAIHYLNKLLEVYKPDKNQQPIYFTKG